MSQKRVDLSSSDSEENEMSEHLRKPFDLYKALGIPNSEKTNGDRVRSAYCKLSYKYYPQSDDAGDKKFHRIGLAFLTFSDTELRRIYDAAGYEGLLKSEEYSEVSIFTKCPYEVHENFFAGVNAEDKEWLLLNGPHEVSDHENDNDDSESDDEVESIDNVVIETSGNSEAKNSDKIDPEKVEEILNKPPPLPEGAALKYGHLLDSSPISGKGEDPWLDIHKSISDQNLKPQPESEQVTVKRQKLM